MSSPFYFLSLVLDIHKALLTIGWAGQNVEAIFVDFLYFYALKSFGPGNGQFEIPPQLLGEDIQQLFATFEAWSRNMTVWPSHLLS